MIKVISGALVTSLGPFVSTLHEITSARKSLKNSAPDLKFSSMVSCNVLLS